MAIAIITSSRSCGAFGDLLHRWKVRIFNRIIAKHSNNVAQPQLCFLVLVCCYYSFTAWQSHDTISYNFCFDLKRQLCLSCWQQLRSCPEATSSAKAFASSAHLFQQKQHLTAARLLMNVIAPRSRNNGILSFIEKRIIIIIYSISIISVQREYIHKPSHGAQYFP